MAAQAKTSSTLSYIMQSNSGVTIDLVPCATSRSAARRFASVHHNYWSQVRTAIKFFVRNRHDTQLAAIISARAKFLTVKGYEAADVFEISKP